jgi:putative ABC transport system permease protein
MSEIWRDIRYAARMLSKQPAFSAVAILTLALGIGANAAIFSIVNAVFLRPLPFPDSSRIYLVARSGNRIGGTNISWAIYLAWQERKDLFETLGGYSGDDATLTGAGEPETLPAIDISSEFFSVLGVQPVQGRDFRAEEARAGGGNVVILSDSIWRTRFAADPGALGRSITLNGKPFTIVGVMARDFELPLPYMRDSKLFLPLRVPAQSQNPSNFMRCIGRLKPGSTPAQVEAALTPPLQALSLAYPDMIFPAEKTRLRPLAEYVHTAAGPAPLLLLGAVGLVLLIACANVANLLLARAASRNREVAIRTALGASRFRILRQLLTESMLLAVAGGACGILACYACFNLILGLVPANLPRIGAISIDSHVLGFALLLSVVTGVIFGLAPTLQSSKTDLQTMLKEGTARAGTGRGRGRLRAVLIVTEVALALVLLIGAALLLESFSRLLRVPLGFDPDHVLTFHLTIPRAKFDTTSKSLALYDDFVGQLAAQPGVRQFGYTSTLPLDQGGDMLFSIEGRTASQDAKGDADIRLVNATYFDALHIPIRSGRIFISADATGSEPVAVINRTMAESFWPGQNPIGEHVWIGKPMGPAATEPAPRRIIGVVADVQEDSLDEAPNSEIYEPYGQELGSVTETYFIVRTAQDPATLVPAVRAQMRSELPDQPLGAPRTLDQIVSASLTDQRFRTTLLSLFGTIGLLIVVVGVYGVVSYFVAQRTHEIGVRMALGATQTSVLRMVLWQGLRLAVAGVVFGVGASLALADLLRSMLYGIAPSDPVTFIGATLVLLVVALAACWIPARRATRVDPIVALRYE